VRRLHREPPGRPDADSESPRLRQRLTSEALRLECSTSPVLRLAEPIIRISRLAMPSTPAYWGRKPNFGDSLSPVIMRQLLRVRPYRTKSPGKVLALGSILHHVRPTDRVFGTGLITEGPVDGAGAEFYAVRGPLTRSLIRNADVPAVYGDPALLMPSYFRPRVQPTGRICVVPHYVDFGLMSSSDPSVVTLDVTKRDWAAMIDTIASSEAVISSSLHGVIVAEAYGVPAVWVEASGNVQGNGFKFRDYYAATDRDVSPVKWSPDFSGILRTAVAPPRFDLVPLVDAGENLRKSLAESGA